MAVCQTTTKNRTIQPSNCCVLKSLEVKQKFGKVVLRSICTVSSSGKLVEITQTSRIIGAMFGQDCRNPGIATKVDSAFNCVCSGFGSSDGRDVEIHAKEPAGA